MEMEALGAGVLRKILVPAGGKAPVGSLIGVIADPNEDISKMLAAGASAAAAAAAPAAPAAAAAKPEAAPAPPVASAPAPAPSSPTPAPAVPAPAPAAPAQAAPAPQAAPVPAPGPRPVAAPTGGEGGRVKASPLARSMAAHRNIPLDSVAGSGPGGRIIKRDIESWSGAPPVARAVSPSPAAPPVPA